MVGSERDWQLDRALLLETVPTGTISTEVKMGIENAARVMKLLGGIKPKNNEEAEYHENTVVAILETGFPLAQQLNYVLPILSRATGDSICTDSYCCEMFEALLISAYSRSDKIFEMLREHTRTVSHMSVRAWIVYPGAIVGALNASTWCQANSATVKLNQKAEELLYSTIAQLLADYFHLIPGDAPPCSEQMLGRFTQALVEHTSHPEMSHKFFCTLLEPFDGHVNKFNKPAHGMANQFLHRARVCLPFDAQIEGVVKAYKFQSKHLPAE